MRIALIQMSNNTKANGVSLAMQAAGLEPFDFFLQEPLAKLREARGFVLVDEGLGEELVRMLKEQSRLGKPILGFGKGALVLVDNGLVPGIEGDRVGLRLVEDKRDWEGYELKTLVRVADDYQYNAFTRGLGAGQLLPVSVQKGLGCFEIPAGLLFEIQVQGLSLFQYADEQGERVAEFPVNPTGSVDNIAAVSNKAGNVLAMVPYLEGEQGELIWRSMGEYILAPRTAEVAPLGYWPRGR